MGQKSNILTLREKNKNLSFLNSEKEPIKFLFGLNFLKSLEQPRESAGTGISREDYIIDLAANMSKQLIQPFDVDVSSFSYFTLLSISYLL